MESATPRGGMNEREFISAGSPESAGKLRELPVVSALPEPPIPMSECTRGESLIFDDRAE
ncbi:MAG TPA: hypothetical protein VF267_03805 [Gammaproteobacteria bacterium]